MHNYFESTVKFEKTMEDGSSLVNFIEYFGVENLEIVGNIFDNPEMLFSF